MTDVVAVRNAVRDLFGRKGDETIREYIIAVLELGDYDFGRNGELAYEHFGQMLVCFCCNLHDCHKICTYFKTGVWAKIYRAVLAKKL